MATGAASGEACSEPLERLECVLVDPARTASLRLNVPAAAGHALTIADVLAQVKVLDAGAGRGVEARRFADGLFLLTDQGVLGAAIPRLRFRVQGKACEPGDRIERPRGAGPLRIEVDRSQSGYARNWPAFLARRWKLREDGYTEFVESVVADACGPEVEAVLRRDTPERIRRFLNAIARRIFDAPYETYSRYLDPGVPFRSCDQTLDRILEGDGGNCAEKAMVLYFVAHGYGIPCEFVLGGEEASGKFPYRALRSILDERAFDSEATRDSQRYWQHYAVLCHPSGHAEDDLLCDVAGSNIPFLCLSAPDAAPYLDPNRRTPLAVTITLEPIPLYYHRLPSRQDLPLDLAYAMEHHIESIDVIHTIQNELGLIHTGDYWVGAFAHRGRRELGRIVGEYNRFVKQSGLDPSLDLCITTDLASARHPLHDRFHREYPDRAARILAAEPRFRQRIEAAGLGPSFRYVMIRLRGGPARG